MLRRRHRCQDVDIDVKTKIYTMDLYIVFFAEALLELLTSVSIGPQDFQVGSNDLVLF